MFSQREIKTILICFLFLLSCAGPGLEISKKEVPVNIALNNESKVIKKYIGPLSNDNVLEIINIIKS